MTEADWLAATDPQPMLIFLQGKASDRKLRLFAVACCQQVERWLWAGEWNTLAITTAEKFADQLTTATYLDVARTGVLSRLELHPGEPVYDASYWACESDIQMTICPCVFYAANSSTRTVDCETPDYDARCDDIRGNTLRAQANLLGDIVGNPFRPVVFDPAWLTETVVALAAGIYAERAFDRMPILADALQDAGCESDDVLTHCRGSGPHARGCWVIDKVLGKS